MPIPLLERSDKEMAGKIRRKVESIEEVAKCKEVTTGFTRKKPSIHFHIVLKGNPTFEETHRICAKVDREVRSLVPNARVIIHSESENAGETGELWKLVKRTADSLPGSRGVQNIHIGKTNGAMRVDFNLQVSKPLLGKRSSDLDSEMTLKLKREDPRIDEVVIHKESVSNLVLAEQSGHGTELRSFIEHVAKRYPELVWLSPPMVRKMDDGLHLVDRVAFVQGISKERATQITTELGEAIRGGIPSIARADIIQEPLALGEM